MEEREGMNVSSEMVSANRLTYEVGAGIGVGVRGIVLVVDPFADEWSFPCLINCSLSWGGISGGKDCSDNGFIRGVSPGFRVVMGCSVGSV